MERELKMLHAKRKNLVVDLKSASKQVKSMVTQQKSMVSQLTSPSSGSFGGLLNKSPSTLSYTPGTHPGPSSGNEIEEGEVKAPLTLSTNGHPNLPQQDSRRKQSSQWGNPLPLRWGSS